MPIWRGKKSVTKIIKHELSGFRWLSLTQPLIQRHSMVVPPFSKFIYPVIKRLILMLQEQDSRLGGELTTVSSLQLAQRHPITPEVRPARGDTGKTYC